MFTVTFDQFNALLQNKIITIIKKKTKYNWHQNFEQHTHTHTHTQVYILYIFDLLRAGIVHIIEQKPTQFPTSILHPSSSTSSPPLTCHNRQGTKEKPSDILSDMNLNAITLHSETLKDKEWTGFFGAWQSPSTSEENIIITEVVGSAWVPSAIRGQVGSSSEIKHPSEMSSI